MKETKSVKLNAHQHQQQENGHFSPFKFDKLLDPEASWDKVYLFSSFCLLTLFEKFTINYSQIVTVVLVILL